jgi:hypothetical protein
MATTFLSAYFDALLEMLPEGIAPAFVSGEIARVRIMVLASQKLEGEWKSQVMKKAWKACGGKMPMTLSAMRRRLYQDEISYPYESSVFCASDYIAVRDGEW